MSEVSERLLAQRLRNRMMEQLTCLVDWQDRLTWGAAEYFNAFFDFFPDRPPLRDNPALTEAEREALTSVLSLMAAAADGTPRDVTASELKASGWPQRVAPVARSALDLMSERGRFSDDLEELEPSVRP